MTATAAPAANKLYRLSPEVIEIKKVIDKYRISQNIISEKIGMNVNTFRVKISGNISLVSFTEKEIEKIKEVLRGLRADLTQIL